MTNSADPDQKPTDLDLQCLLRQGMSCSAREGLIFNRIKVKFKKRCDKLKNNNIETLKEAKKKKKKRKKDRDT